MYALQHEPERARRKRFLLGAGAFALLLQGSGLVLAHRITPPKRPRSSSITVTVTRMSVPKPAPEPKPEPKPAPKPEPVPKPEAKAERAKPKPKPKARPKPRKARPKRRLAKKAPPPPKPAPVEAPKAPPKPRPRLIAGLSMSSTVKGGAGPSFGVGNTAMGTPDQVAAGRVSPVKGHPNIRQDQGPAGPVTAPHRAVRRPAKLLRKAMPEYPRAARQQGIEGNIVLSLVIDDQGRVVKVRVIKGLGHGLDEAAVSAVRKTRWSPATLDGHPVRTTRRFNVRFTLES